MVALVEVIHVMFSRRLMTSQDHEYMDHSITGFFMYKYMMTIITRKFVHLHISLKFVASLSRCGHLSWSAIYIVDVAVSQHG